MPRLAEARPPAAPSSSLQREKYERMLSAAAELGSIHDFDHVQMHDVARRAGVAIATLYRYFPSKPHLFTAVMLTDIRRMTTAATDSGHARPHSAEAAAEALIGALRSMMRRPVLAASMIRSSNLGSGTLADEMVRLAEGFADALFAAMGLADPTIDQRTLIRLLTQQWFGIMQSCLNGHIDVVQAEADIRLACDLLLAPMADRGTW